MWKLETGSTRFVSVEPLPKQGCERMWKLETGSTRFVSVEPLPKQGCELSSIQEIRIGVLCLSGTPAEAGVRAFWPKNKSVKGTGLSGTPAEAGVRGLCRGNFPPSTASLSGTPAEAGVRANCAVPYSICKSSLSGTPAEAGVREVVNQIRFATDNGSQWNPCRSRGASAGRRGRVPMSPCLSGTPAEAGVRAILYGIS